MARSARRNTVMGNSQRNLDKEFPEGISKRYKTALTKFKTFGNTAILQKTQKERYKKRRP